MILALVKNHWAFGVCLDHVETLNAVEERLYAVPNGLPALIRFLRFADAVGAVFRKERHNAVDVMAWPSRAKIVHYLDVRLFGCRLLGGVGSAVHAYRCGET